MADEPVQTNETEELVGAKSELADAVVKENLAMIQSIAASIAAGGKLPPGIYFNDLISFGYEGFIKAHNSFDKEKGVQFQTYAAYRVRGEILDRLRKEWKYRNPVSYKSVQARIQERIAEVVQSTLEISEEDDEETKEERSSLEEKKRRAADIIANSAVVYILSIESDEVRHQISGTSDIESELFSEIEFAQERRILWEEIGNLSDAEKDFIHLFYEKEKTQKEIAGLMTMSKSKISRLHVKILQKLRNKLARKLDS